MRILFVKLSSMGDIFHCYDGLSDFRSIYPQATIDWLVDSKFAEISTWHNDIDQIHALPFRAYKNKKNAQNKRALKQAIAKLKNHRYDAIVDAQGLLKSAFFATKAKGRLYGFNFKSCREPLASFFYQKRYAVSQNLHAVTRIRELLAHIGNYHDKLSSMPLQGLKNNTWQRPPLAPKRYGVIFPNTTWASKHWPDDHWQRLINQLTTESGQTIVIGWGNTLELERAKLIAGDSPNVIIPEDRLSLGEVAQWIAYGDWIVGVDTGFLHLASAMQKPVIGLFGPTSPQHSGVFGENAQNLSIDLSCMPCRKKTCKISSDPRLAECMTNLSIARVLKTLEPLII